MKTKIKTFFAWFAIFIFILMTLVKISTPHFVLDILTYPDVNVLQFLILFIPFLYSVKYLYNKNKK